MLFSHSLRTIYLRRRSVKDKKGNITIMKDVYLSEFEIIDLQINTDIMTLDYINLKVTSIN